MTRPSAVRRLLLAGPTSRRNNLARPAGFVCHQCFRRLSQRRQLSLDVRSSPISCRLHRLRYAVRGPVLPTARRIAARSLATASEGGDHGPLEEYDERVHSRRLREDGHQRNIIQYLQDLHDILRSYNPPEVARPSISSLRPRSKYGLSRLFGSRGASSETSVQIPEDLPKGLYMHGDVGSGKTMLMDLFYETLPPNIHNKTRIHFHNFMQDVHRRMHRVKSEYGDEIDAIAYVAAEIAEAASVLCFDEFQCTDVADAMILRRLIEGLMGHGVVIVTTSNRHPTELYKNGIQRQSFVPCIDLLLTRLRVISLDSPTDYRKIPRPPSGVYHHPIDAGAAPHAERWFKYLGDFEHDPPHPAEHEVWGRKVVVPHASGRAARYDFWDLMGKATGAADYLELVKWYDSFIVTGVPGMTYRERDLARRFITFVDAVYESRAKIVLTTAVPLARLFLSPDQLSDALSKSDAASESTKTTDKTPADPEHPDFDVDSAARMMMDDLGLNMKVMQESGLFSGDEERFAFARALSRLSEMGSMEWVERGRGSESESKAEKMVRILTSRKYGIATIWLVATLGSKSAHRRITRKAIQGVDIERACETVAEPDAPMALRLQGNLLYGISRIYGRRCEYVLVDAQHTQTGLINAWKAIKDAQLDPQAGHANPEQLVMRDDPGFVPDDLVPSFDLDLGMFESSQMDSSLSSILSRKSQVSSLSDNSAFGIIIPSSDTGMPGGSMLPDQAIQGHGPMLSLEAEDLELDLGFEFDDDGHLVDHTSPEKHQPDLALGQRIRSDSQASAIVRQDIEDGLLAGELYQNDISLPQYDVHGLILPPAEPFPTTHPQQPDQPHGTSPAAAPRRLPRALPPDKTLQVRNAVLTEWNTYYVSNMAVALALKLKHRMPHQARKNAAYYVLDRGLGDAGIARAGLHGPLSMFSGTNLYLLLTGIDLSVPGAGERKRKDSPTGDGGGSPAKRLRADEAEVGRGAAEGGEGEDFGDESIEIPRHASDAPLWEDHSSAMPWNQPSSQPGSRAGSRGGSQPGGSKPGSRAGSRPPSALRSATATAAPRLPSDTHRHASSTSLDAGGFGPGFSASASPRRSTGHASAAGAGTDDDVVALLHDGRGAGAGAGGGDDESVLWESAGQVDAAAVAGRGQASLAQQASLVQQQSQAAREALLAETRRFLHFVVLRAGPVGDGGWAAAAFFEAGPAGRRELPVVSKTTSFERLVAPGLHARNVAAQAFLHVLSLASSGDIRVVQDVCGGDIGIGVVAGSAEGLDG